MMDLRQLRRSARLTQFELAQRTGINRVRLSFAECGYTVLSRAEQDAIRTAIAGAAKSHTDRIRRALAENQGEDFCEMEPKN